jgi:hypothetical protein
MSTMLPQLNAFTKHYNSALVDYSAQFLQGDGELDLGDMWDWPSPWFPV